MAENDKWVEISVLTSREAVEAVCVIFYDNGVGGVAINDPQDIIDSQKRPGDWDYIDDKLLPEYTGEVKVRGYLPYSDNIKKCVESIKLSVDRLSEYGLDKGKAEVTTREVREKDWANAWKEYYKPFRIGENIVIKPSWEPYDAMPEDIVLELDPGMAFGTGSHETTKMCIEFLQKYVKKGVTVFDLGCGSGILSIAASKLGSDKVYAVDIDEVAVRSSMENIKISGVNNVYVRQGSLFDVIEGRADVIVANIIADVIIKIADTVPKYLNDGGVFIASGIIKDRAQDVKEALSRNKLDILDIKEMGEWVAIVAAPRE